MTRENLTLSTANNLQPRRSVLNVVKIRSYPVPAGEVQTDFTRSPGPARQSEKDTAPGWVNNYVVIAENRPLKTLLEMKNNAQIEFTETDYELQYKLYYEVSRLSCQVGWEHNNQSILTTSSKGGSHLTQLGKCFPS